MFYPWCFFYLFHLATSELPQPIAEKLCHMIAIWVHFIMQVQKFGGPKKLESKTCKIWANFIKLQTSIMNISGMGQDIQNRKDMWSTAIPPTLHEKSHEKSPVNFGPLITENCVWVWTHPNWIFRETIFRPLGVLAPQILTRTTDWPRLTSAHP